MMTSCQSTKTFWTWWRKTQKTEMIQTLKLSSRSSNKKDRKLPLLATSCWEQKTKGAEEEAGEKEKEKGEGEGEVAGGEGGEKRLQVNLPRTAVKQRKQPSLLHPHQHP